MYQRPVNPEKLSESENITNYIKSFEGPAENLLRQLDGNIRRGVYSHIIGLDASGRIPALIVGEYITEVSKKMGVDVPARLFAIPHHVDSSTPQLTSLFNSAQEIIRDQKKVLIVDDTLYSAHTLTLATNELRNNSIPFDIAVFLGLNKSEIEDVHNTGRALGAEEIFVGGFRNYRLDTLVKNKDLLGVWRDGYDTMKTTSKRDIPNTEDLAQSRKEIHKLVNDLIAKIDQGDVTP